MDCDESFAIAPLQDMDCESESFMHDLCIFMYFMQIQRLIAGPPGVNKRSVNLADLQGLLACIAPL